MRTSFLGFAFALLLLSPAFSQTQETTPPPDQKDQEKVTEQDKIPTFRKNVTVVNVQFNVKDKHGALVPNLEKTAKRRTSSISPL